MMTVSPLDSSGEQDSPNIGSVKREAEQLAQQLREAVQARPEDRLNLHAVARHLGVALISFTPLTVDGRVESTPEGAHIRIRENMSDTRKRFTLAHELAHLALGHVGTRSRSSELAAEREERLCDAIAASLLMPRDLVQDWLDRDEPTIERLVNLANTLGVSRHALVRRVNEVEHRTCVLLQFRRNSNYWVALPETFGRIPVSGPRRPRLSGTANDVLETVQHDTAVALLIRFGSQAFDASGSASRLDREPGRAPLIHALITHLERDRAKDASAT